MAPEQWFFDELAHAGKEHRDPAYAAAYDRKAQTDPTIDLARLEALGLNDETSLVDFGAGTGTFALAAARVCKRVVAVDVSSPMLDILRDRVRSGGLRNVDVVHGGFLSYQHQASPADFAYSRHALHHLPDFWKAIAVHRVAATLRTGGIFYLSDLVYSFDPQDADPVISAWLASAPAQPENGYTASDLATHVRTEYSTYSWLLEPMLARAGFEIHDSEYRLSVFAAYTCVKR